MEEAKSYYNIVTAIWKLFKASLPIVQDITDDYDPRLYRIEEDFKQIVKEAPESMKDYADSMMRLHVKTLEDMWRYR